ncbi:sugar kinase [Halalkalibacter krulwichiae]|uniref:2-dehydro-3-deoxygluconokinase n=1 Tax=Halalkalibacter krulwichiae TaxID=199441 RepID=A0A1X9MAD0_9BACI|nr:sugar kinase [Halalkalibacter krulwichiae]ARK29550.1 2-dehydro-3-deoxygluconokinase [Halalkalibacter krulwichiae]
MDVVTIGESMAVFSPESTPLMRYAATYSRKFGGAESNVAIGLTRLGHQVGWISKVGNDELGKGLLSFIRGEGVNVDQVKVDASAPTGLYFKEVRSASNVRVEYYRKGSAASQLTPNDLNEDYIAGAQFLHITGITPALSESCYETIMHSISIAKENGVKVVFDPNLRKKLWSEERARQVLLEIAAKSDVVLPGVAEGEFMFGEQDPEKLGELFLNYGASLVIIKVGAKGAYYFTKEEQQLVPGFPVDQVIDPVGAGDGFAAGVISGLLDQLSLYEVVERANAVGALATQIPGDFEGLPTREEIDQFLNATDVEDINR